MYYRTVCLQGFTASGVDHLQQRYLPLHRLSPSIDTPPTSLFACLYHCTVRPAGHQVLHSSIYTFQPAEEHEDIPKAWPCETTCSSKGDRPTSPVSYCPDRGISRLTWTVSSHQFSTASIVHDTDKAPRDCFPTRIRYPRRRPYTTEVSSTL